MVIDTVRGCEAGPGRHGSTSPGGRGRWVQSSGMFVSDLRHFLDMPDDAPGPARKMAEQLGNVVRAATAAEASAAWVSALPCRRRRGRPQCRRRRARRAARFRGRGGQPRARPPTPAASRPRLRRAQRRAPGDGLLTATLPMTLDQLRADLDRGLRTRRFRGYQESAMTGDKRPRCSPAAALSRRSSTGPARLCLT